MNPTNQPSAAVPAPAPSWVVYDGNVYRADHKLAPFTDSKGTHHPDYHDGLLAIVYGKEHLGLVAAAPLLFEACEQAEFWLSEEVKNPGTATPEEILGVLGAAIAMARGGAK